MVNAVIMASGYSTRMGKNKLMLPFKGKPIIEHVIDAIKECKFNEIILVGQEKEVLDIAKKKNILNCFKYKSLQRAKSIYRIRYFKYISIKRLYVFYR